MICKVRQFFDLMTMSLQKKERFFVFLKIIVLLQIGNRYLSPSA